MRSHCREVNAVSKPGAAANGKRFRRHVRFDDRLKTVMIQPVADAHDRTVRWRQIVDLLSRSREPLDPALFDAALAMVRSEFPSIEVPIRAATARSIAGRTADPRLVALFAADQLEVAAPLLASVSLQDAGWKIVSAAASPDVSEFLRTLRGESEPPAVEPVVSDLAPTAAPAAAPEEIHSISEMVARIERLKLRRETDAAPASTNALPENRPQQAPVQSGTTSLFRWECDAAGEIGWVEGAPRGALIGRSLPADEQVDRVLVRAFADRLPFDGAALTFPAPALEGEWRLSGIPAFSPVDGRFLGYRGVARREGAETGPPAPGPAAPAKRNGDAEALRETIHEIKTPLNAIIGFAEIIDGQYLGPAHRNYRLRAAEIVTQARTLLGAIDDLDFAAKLQSDRAVPGEGTDFGEVFPRFAEEFNEYAARREVGVLLKLEGNFGRCALDPDLSERLIRRFVTSVIDAAGAGETLSLEVAPIKAMCGVVVTRPNAIKGTPNEQLLDPAFATDTGEMLGIGFALRLVRGLARIAGGDLRLTADELILLIPAMKSAG